MKVAHLLRKCDPDEWGGTETYLLRLVEALRGLGVQSVLFSPRLRGASDRPDPFERAGFPNRRFHALLPILGLDRERRAQAWAVGGNLLSADAPIRLALEPAVDLIHTHALNRLGGVARTVARLRGLPYVVSIHGGVTALDPAEALRMSRPGGFDWGRPYGLLVGSRRVLQDADAIVTFNEVEAKGLRERYPAQRVVTIPHGIPLDAFRRDQRGAAWTAYPVVRDRRVLLAVGRVHPAKNQRFLIECLPRLAQRYPDALLVLVGPVNDPEYERALHREAASLRVEDHVLWAGELPPDDPRLIGLYQVAEAVVLASRLEAFGLTLVEALAAGTPVVASRTPGASSIVRAGQDGFLFDLDDAEAFCAAVGRILDDQDLRARLAQHAQVRAREYDLGLCARRTLALYEEVLKERRR